MPVNQTGSILLAMSRLGGYPLQFFDGGLDRLQTAVEWTRIDAEWLGMELRSSNMFCQLVRLPNAM
jgi:hypothetical protein